MRVAVFGAGYAGLTVARRLERRLPADVELVVVDESDVHLLQHELHRVVRYPGLADVISVPLDEVLERATVRRARVVDVDTDRGVATLEDAGETGTLSYDVAAVCLGAETAFYDLPGVETHATPLKRLEHARRIRREALAAPGGEAVVGGAGLSGIQVAGELAALSAAEDLDLGVTVVEMADRVAPQFDPVFADAVRRELEARGIAVETGVPVESADAGTVSLADGRTLPHDVLVWAGGIRGPDALGGERLPAAADLLVGEATFVVGDAGDVVDEGGEAVPASAQTAVREAKVAAKNVLRVVNGSRVSDEAAVGDGDDTPPRFHAYEFDSPGWIVSVGDGAVAQVGPLVFTGEAAKAAKAAVGVGHLASVGAITRASELVREELGWPAGDAVEFSAELIALGRQAGGEAADPATPTELEAPVAALLGVAEGIAGEEPLDLTELTRLLDPDHPGSPANVLERTVRGAVRSALPPDGSEGCESPTDGCEDRTGE